MILLDTHVFIWLGAGSSNLSSRAAREISANPLGISSITYLEIGSLVSKKRLEIPCSLSEYLHQITRYFELTVLPIRPEIVEVAFSLPPHVSSDPADRIIAATAIVNDSRLVTKDKNLRMAKEIPTIW